MDRFTACLEGCPLQIEQAEGWGGLLRPNLQARVSLTCQSIFGADIFSRHCIWADMADVWTKFIRATHIRNWRRRAVIARGLCSPVSRRCAAGMAADRGRILGFPRHNPLRAAGAFHVTDEG
jgi:hypothetical protein